ncbi:exosortase B [Inhella sp.]|uniref:exosortase B n=1 Tax=Inhella sp. TaxID=1921806 RepID=UPI0035AEEDBA
MSNAPATQVNIAEPLRRTDLLCLGALLLAYLVLFIPSYLDLSKTVWASDEQGHGPIILAVSGWLLYQQRHAVWAVEAKPSFWLGVPLLVLGVFCYAFGRSQSILLFEISAQILLLAAMLTLLLGTAALRAVWFPLFFMLFMVPLPEVLVTALTTPLKSAVSAVASAILYQANYPVGRAGVILTVGPYQLLVADACAGLNSMFTLEALGMLYMKLMNYTSVARNVALAVLLIPIAFAANVVRVMILVLVTYHFGDEAGQGFIHGFAGMVLFMVALMLMLVVDRFLNLKWHRERAK